MTIQEAQARIEVLEDLYRFCLEPEKRVLIRREIRKLQEMKNARMAVRAQGLRSRLKQLINAILAHSRQSVNNGRGTN